MTLAHHEAEDCTWWPWPSMRLSTLPNDPRSPWGSGLYLMALEHHDAVDRLSEVPQPEGGVLYRVDLVTWGIFSSTVHMYSYIPVLAIGTDQFVLHCTGIHRSGGFLWSRAIIRPDPLELAHWSGIFGPKLDTFSVFVTLNRTSTMRMCLCIMCLCITNSLEILRCYLVKQAHCPLMYIPATWHNTGDVNSLYWKWRPAAEWRE
jgi:hypothetical protein